MGRPEASPDIALGAQIFAEHCTRCHGVGGKGDGELVQSGDVPRPLDFTDPATSGSQRPDTWFNTITNGTVEHLMPPWRDELTDAERWAVAMYTYTLPYTAEQIARGRDIFAANCVECHGEGGRGDGERADEIATVPADLTDLGEMATLSRDLIFQIVTEGSGDDMPSFADELTDGERRDVVAYARTFALANADAIGMTVEVTAEAPASTQEASPATVTAAGQITNGTATGVVPADLPVILYSFDASLNRTQQTASADAGGSFALADVSFDPAGTYVATVTYRDRIFASTLLSGDALATDAADGALDLPITIYDLTEDPDVIQITGLVSQVTVVGDSLQVAQVFSFANTSDRAFTSSQTTTSGQPISVVIALPPGAIVAGFGDSGDRYVIDQDNFVVYDTIPVIPGEDHIVQLIYLIPYNNDAIIEQQMTYAVDGPVRLLLNPPTIRVTSDQLPMLNIETVGNTQYQSYGGQLTLQPGDVLRYEVSGEGLTAAQNADRSAPVVSSTSLPLIIVGALVIIGLLVGGLYLIAVRNRAGDQQVIDILIRQIAELDTDHAAGQIPDDAYQQQRAALKTRLAALMERKK
ncbi:MAG: c-type cytochrome [Anaerolineae bacterium]|nr:c-type cytochrome [Anaerolineae bacterium]